MFNGGKTTITILDYSTATRIGVGRHPKIYLSNWNCGVTHRNTPLCFIAALRSLNAAPDIAASTGDITFLENV